MVNQKKIYIPVGFTQGQRKTHKEKLSVKLEAAGWQINEYFDGGCTKASYFIAEGGSDKKLPSFLHLWQKVILVIVGVGVLGAMLPGTPEHKPPAKPDKELFMNYYSDLKAKTDAADQMYMPFAAALKNRDIVGATQVALQIKQPISSLWGEISRIESPALQNKAAKEKLDKAKEAISGAYLYKSSLVRDFIKFTESQNIKKLAELGNTSNDMQTLLLGGTTYLAEAGSLVGVKLTDMHK